MQAFYFVFDAALAALSLRSIAVLRSAAPWTSGGWAGTVGYCVAAILEFSFPAFHRTGAVVAYVFVVLLAIAFVIAGVRDEPQAEPWYWPTRVGPTRAERRARY